MLKRYAERQLRKPDGLLAISKATIGSNFASTLNKQTSTLLLKVQDISPYRGTLHLQKQMEAKEQTLFDEIAYLSPAFPMSHQNSQPIVFGMRLRDGDKTSVEAVTLFKSLIAWGIDWVHFGECMARPSGCRNYRVSSSILHLSACANIAVDREERKRIGAGLGSWFASEG